MIMTRSQSLCHFETLWKLSHSSFVLSQNQCQDSIMLLISLWKSLALLEKLLFCLITRRQAWWWFWEAVIVSFACDQGDEPPLYSKELRKVEIELKIYWVIYWVVLTRWQQHMWTKTHRVLLNRIDSWIAISQDDFKKRAVLSPLLTAFLFLRPPLSIYLPRSHPIERKIPPWKGQAAKPRRLWQSNALGH